PPARSAQPAREGARAPSAVREPCVLLAQTRLERFDVAPPGLHLGRGPRTRLAGAGAGPRLRRGEPRAQGLEAIATALLAGPQLLGFAAPVGFRLAGAGA